jgi:hypothetical protein
MSYATLTRAMDERSTSTILQTLKHGKGSDLTEDAPETFALGPTGTDVPDANVIVKS